MVLGFSSSNCHLILDILYLIFASIRSRRRYVKNKQTARPKAIARALKSQCLMDPGIGSAEEAKELLADLLDETVRAGVQLITYGLGHPLQPSGSEGAEFCQPMFGTSTEAKTSGTLANAGDQFCKTMLETFREAKTSGTLANAGTKKHVVEAGCHTNTARQDLVGRRKSREEPAIVEEDRDKKLQRSTGAFGAASLVVPRPNWVVHLLGEETDGAGP